MTTAFDFDAFDTALDDQIAEDSQSGTPGGAVIGLVKHVDYGLKVLMTGAGNAESFWPLTGEAISNRKSDAYKTQYAAIVQQARALAATKGFVDDKTDKEKSKAYFKATKLRPAILIHMDGNNAYKHGEKHTWAGGDRYWCELMEVWNPETKKNARSEAYDVTYKSMRDTGTPPGTANVWMEIAERKSPSERQDGQGRDVWIPYISRVFKNEADAMAAVAEQPKRAESTGVDGQPIVANYPNLTPDQTAQVVALSFDLATWQGTAVPMIVESAKAGQTVEQIAGEFLRGADDGVAIVNAVLEAAKATA